jgi:hypothetical protein
MSCNQLLLPNKIPLTDLMAVKGIKESSVQSIAMPYFSTQILRVNRSFI